MRLFRLIVLFSGSLLALTGCSPLRGFKKDGNQIVGKNAVSPVLRKESSVFFTEIRLYSKRYSGLLIFRETSQDSGHLTFITQIGMKMFEFAKTADSLHPLYFFEPLNKPAVVRLLKRDFETLLLLRLFEKNAEYCTSDDGRKAYVIRDKPRTYYLCKDQNVRQVIEKKWLIRKRLQYEYDPACVLNKIELKHKGLMPIRFRLTRIEQTKQ